MQIVSEDHTQRHANCLHAHLNFGDHSVYLFPVHPDDLLVNGLGRIIVIFGFNFFLQDVGGNLIKIIF